MSTEAFGAWSLILQLSAYVGYFDFGIQTAVGRFVAHSTERKDFELRTRVVSSAFVLLSAMGFLALLTIGVVALSLPNLFHQIHGHMVFETRITLLLVGGSLALGLPGSVFSSTFLGLQRNEIPAAVIGISRLLGAVLVVAVVRQGGDLAPMGIVTAAVNVLALLVQFALMRRLLPDVTISISRATWPSAREIISYCGSLSIWSIGMLLVTGLDLAIVGMYRFNDLAYYAVAATLVTFLNGLFGAIFGALGSPAAVLHARNDRVGLGSMVATSTRVSMLLLLAVGLPLIVAAHPILRAWVGPAYADHATPLLQILVAANMIRMCISPYIIAMIGTGEQSKIVLVPVLEGIVNLGVSLFLVRSLGVAGVAWGTLLGSIVSLGGHLIYTTRQSHAIELGAMNYLQGSLLRPLVCGVPILVGGVLLSSQGNSIEFWLRVLLICAVGIATVLLFWTIGLKATERWKICSLLGLGRSSS
jgi:O-antigen/teichoic acid export membrane protein